MADFSENERLRMRDRPAGWPVMRQVWRHVGFLHWPVEIAAINRLLPPGLEADTFDGVAYVGAVPFTIPITRAAVVGPPVAPAFHELNLRTYVHRGGRDPGVWFFSLDAASRLAVAGARLAYALPYFHARMALVQAGEGTSAHIAYTSRRYARTGIEPAEFRATYGPIGPAAPAAPGTLEFFLIERYLLYAFDGRRLRTARVFHAPYPVQPAQATAVDQSLTRAAGLPAAACAAPPPLVHYAAEADVRIFRPRPLPPT